MPYVGTSDIMVVKGLISGRNFVSTRFSKRLIHCQNSVDYNLLKTFISLEKIQIGIHRNIFEQHPQRMCFRKFNALVAIASVQTK